MYLSTSKSSLRKVYLSKNKKYLHFQSTFKLKSTSILVILHTEVANISLATMLLQNKQCSLEMHYLMIIIITFV